MRNLGDSSGSEAMGWARVVPLSVMVLGLLISTITQAQWSTSTLSSARYSLAATSVGTKVFFAGGVGNTSRVDIYDNATNTWTTAELSQGRSQLAAASVGTKVFFAGGSGSNVVDIYDNSTNTWTTATLSQAGSQFAAISVGTKALFAGGSGTNVVDIYDNGTNTWTTATLSQPRSELAAASVGTKAFFAGGSGSDVVDIYDNSTNTWTTATLSQARGELVATAVGNKVLFAGGYVGSPTYMTDVVDIYNNDTNTWTTATLTEARRWLTATSDGTRAFFAGGQILGGGSSDVVDIYNINTNAWTSTTLSQARLLLASASIGTKAFFGGGIRGTTSYSTVDIYDSDVTAPNIVSFSPLDNATEVGLNSNLVLTFNEPVQKGTGNILIKEGGLTEQTIAVGNVSVTVSGTTVTIDPPVDFNGSAGVNIELAAGTFKDLNSNIHFGITNATTWNFVVATPPEVIALLPATNSTGVAINTNLVMTFSESVQKGNGSILIKEGGITAQTIAVTDASVIVSGTIVTIDPPVDFSSSAAVNIEMTGGVFKDLSNSDYAGITDVTTWNFTVVDILEPTISTLSPADNAFEVAVNSTLAITFNESVQKGTGNIIIKENGITMQTIAVTDASVTVSGSTVTINLPLDLASGASVNIEIDAGSIKDLFNNNYAGISNVTIWNFTVADMLVPTVSTLSPADNAIGVSVNSNLVILFNENVQKGTGNILIKKSGSTTQSVPVNNASVTVSGATVTIDPADFTSGSAVNIEITTGAFKDLSNNIYAGISSAVTWNFTVADILAPIVSTFSPADNATGVSINSNLIITYGENIQKGTGSIVIKENGVATQTIAITDASVTVSGTTVTINPPLDLASSASVNIEIADGVFKDLCNNNYSGITNVTTWNFTVADVLPPTMSTLAPTDNATWVPSNSNLVITFNENMQKGIGNILIKEGGVTTQTIPATDASVIVSGTAVTINPADFGNYASANIEIAAGTFKDLANNNYAGTADATTWNFSVTDSSPPVLEADNTTNFLSSGSGVNIAARFSDPQTEVAVVTVSYRSVTSPGTQKSMTLEKMGLDWLGTIPPSDIGELGIEYKLEASNGAGLMQSTPYNLIRIHQDTFTIPYSNYGSSPSNFRIISVPLDLDKPSAHEIFGNELGTYDKFKWRLFQHKGSTKELSGISPLKPGDGYWLISASDPGTSLTTGAGLTVNATADNPFKLVLFPGWNQIGNPYNFNLSWTDILTANPSLNAANTKLWTFEQGGYSNSGTLLKKGEGGFVLAAASTTLTFPVTKNNSVNNGRITEAKNYTSRNSIDSDNWEIHLNLIQGERKNSYAGIGMRLEASESFDKYDAVTPPRFIEYLEINHEKTFLANRFAKDIVPTSRSYTWSFAVESSSNKELASMEWNSSFFGENENELYLVDESERVSVNMRSLNSYAFQTPAKFKIIFGDSDYLSKTLPEGLGKIIYVSPNPSSNEVRITISLPGWQKNQPIRIDLLNTIGQSIAPVYSGNLVSGSHELQWSGLTKGGDRPSPGIYFFRLLYPGGNSIYRIALN